MLFISVPFLAAILDTNVLGEGVTVLKSKSQDYG